MDPVAEAMAHKGVRRAWENAVGFDPSAASSSSSESMSGEDGKRIIPEEGDMCGVCYEDLEPGSTEGLEFCLKSCGRPDPQRLPAKVARKDPHADGYGIGVGRHGSVVDERGNVLNLAAAAAAAAALEPADEPEPADAPEPAATDATTGWEYGGEDDISDLGARGSGEAAAEHQTRVGLAEELRRAPLCTRSQAPNSHSTASVLVSPRLESNSTLPPSSTFHRHTLCTRHGKRRNPVMASFLSQASSYFGRTNISVNYTIDESQSPAHCGLWKIFRATRNASSLAPAAGGSSSSSASKNTVSIWTHTFNTRGQVRQRITEQLKKEASSLTRLRHPCILEVVEPLEESRNDVTFATEQPGLCRLRRAQQGLSAVSQPQLAAQPAGQRGPARHHHRQPELVAHGQRCARRALEPAHALSCRASHRGVVPASALLQLDPRLDAQVHGARQLCRTHQGGARAVPQGPAQDPPAVLGPPFAAQGTAGRTGAHDRPLAAAFHPAQRVPHLEEPLVARIHQLGAAQAQAAVCGAGSAAEHAAAARPDRAAVRAQDGAHHVPRGGHAASVCCARGGKRAGAGKGTTHRTSTRRDPRIRARQRGALPQARIALCQNQGAQRQGQLSDLLPCDGGHSGQSMAAKVDRETLATAIIPQLWIMSMGPLLNADQFGRFMKAVREMSTRVEKEHTAHLRDVKRMQEHTDSYTADARAGGPGANGAAGGVTGIGAGGEIDFATLVGQTKTARGADKAVADDPFGLADDFGALGGGSSGLGGGAGLVASDISPAVSSTPTPIGGLTPTHTGRSAPKPSTPSLFSSSTASSTASSVPALAPPPSFVRPPLSASSSSTSSRSAAPITSATIAPVNGSWNSVLQPSSSSVAKPAAATSTASGAAGGGGAGPNYNISLPPATGTGWNPASSSLSSSLAPAIEPAPPFSIAPTPAASVGPPGWGGSVLQPNKSAAVGGAGAKSTTDAWKDFDPFA
ncbi:hypothetical protein L1887_61059 [Cichorium endivia]|nr:hypothetical protein L1887_61059 [Cichorium endivia]